MEVIRTSASGGEKRTEKARTGNNRPEFYTGRRQEEDQGERQKVTTAETKEREGSD